MNKNIKIILFSLAIFNLDSQTSSLTQAIKNKYCQLTADYVIVGVGTGGALMANRLSGDLQTSVIALHSGDILTDDPIIALSRNAAITVPAALVGPPLYENGLTTPQIDANNRLLLWALGLPEGGASSINAGAWSRETNVTNAQWEALAGPNWSIPIITDLYKELENYHGQTTNPGARGFRGPISVRQVPDAQVTNVSRTITQAITNATGFPFVEDYNDPQTPIGPSTQLQYTQSAPDGTFRVSSAVAFLNESVVTPAGMGVNGRKLQVLFESTALRTIWSGDTAIGVEFLKDGVTQKAMAIKGVIVCAGLKSSSFLMHSGIGAKSLLESLNIPVKFDNPNVGQNLADHNSIITLFSTDPDDTPVPPLDPNSLFTQIAYLPDPTGDQTVRAFRIASLNPVPGLATVLFDLCPPKSRGSIVISSADPLVPPTINTGILTNNDDLNLYVRGFQIYINNINTQINLLNSDYKLIYPDPSILMPGNEAILIEFIKDNINSTLHYQSHCRMAPLDQGGVVDSTGHVYGVKNLIVADDSIVPQDMDGSPMASAYLMAANVARLLLQ